jgi:hypothetical protein
VPRLSAVQTTVPNALPRKIRRPVQEKPLRTEPATRRLLGAPEARKPHCSAVCEALCRTRTGDPFLTIDLEAWERLPVESCFPCSEAVFELSGLERFGLILRLVCNWCATDPGGR